MDTNRIKQLEGRMAYLRGFISSRWYNRSTNERACRMIKTCRSEYDKLTNEKSF